MHAGDIVLLRRVDESTFNLTEWANIVLYIAANRPVRYNKLSWCWEARATGCFMLTGSVPISYRFRDKGEFESKMHLTPASRLILNFISHLTSYCHHRCHRYLLTTHSITINHAPLPRPPDVANLLSSPSRCTWNSPISYGTLRTHGTHRVNTMAYAQKFFKPLFYFFSTVI